MSIDSIKKLRCKVCKRKTGINFFECKCDTQAVFCDTHRYNFAHECTIDIKKQHKIILVEQNPKITINHTYNDI